MNTPSDKSIEPRVVCSNREKWRNWLQEHHDNTAVAWLVFYKKHTGTDCISYRDSVEEALCFGWIDGLKRRIDEDRYAYRFTARKKNSKWSPLNISLAEKMIAGKKMTPAGLQAFGERKTYDPEFLQTRTSKEVSLPPEIEDSLRKNKNPWENYKKMAPGYRRKYAGWIISAKRPETRKKRLEQAILMLEQNKKPGM
jgi:uncharacterized protein YdeI (YjbR/CyaY-like superfamily)